ncbi:MBL fold metallo-hydrolase [Nocardia takedensis]|uniref:MBL fold metallo-hydrolase n=1 Tax=Nocardia takedensis TaxID=259390 RepID=UPI000688AAFB|nr:MBL fold metallo-hydrolase [Nocardia takedensis]
MCELSVRGLAGRFPGVVLPAVPPLRPAGEPGSESTIRARRRFLGSDVVDADTGAVRADRVALSWVGCATYVLAIGGVVVLLDAWVPRLMSSGYVPASPQDLADLRPAAILIGHGHFDHAGDAGRIAEASGAVVYGTAEHCAAIRAQVLAPSFPTVALGDAATPPGHSHEFTVGPVAVTAIRHLHSAPTAPDRDDPARPFFPRPRLAPILRHPPTRADLAETVPRLRDAEGGVLLYQVRVPGFSLVWHDSSGPLTERAPQVLETLAALPGTDLHIGAVQGYNQITNGLRDPRRYIEALAPALFVPTHHDNWLPGLTAPAATYDRALHAEVARVGSAPRVRTLHDRIDYVRPERLTFRL